MRLWSGALLSSHTADESRFIRSENTNRKDSFFGVFLLQCVCFSCGLRDFSHLKIVNSGRSINFFLLSLEILPSNDASAKSPQMAYVCEFSFITPYFSNRFWSDPLLCTRRDEEGVSNRQCSAGPRFGH